MVTILNPGLLRLLRIPGGRGGVFGAAGIVKKQPAAIWMVHTVYQIIYYSRSQAKGYVLLRGKNASVCVSMSLEHSTVDLTDIMEKRLQWRGDMK